jgi:catechol 2,3-dioxygenase-like lactoylglutathione lyase family enzyme
MESPARTQRRLEKIDMMANTDPKSLASRLRTRLAADGTQISRAQALEIVAAQLGYRDWNTCAAAAVSAPPPETVPILRTFPGEEARRFYVAFLGFAVDWEHRFGEGMPLYQQVSRAGCVLHLSEHHGDATPGSAVRIEIPDAQRLQRELARSAIYPLRIGLQSQPWGDELAVPDPFGNRIIFHTPRAAGDAPSERRA